MARERSTMTPVRPHIAPGLRAAIIIRRILAVRFAAELVPKALSADCADAELLGCDAPAAPEAAGGTPPSVPLGCDELHAVFSSVLTFFSTILKPSLATR